MQHTTWRAVARGTTALVSLALSAQLVSAQATEEEGFLGTIVLGESKREVQTQTAQSITVVDQEEITDRQAGTVAELVDSVPGVTLVNGATAQGSGINIRGFGANSTFGTDQKVLIQIDGATKGSEELYRIGSQLFTDPFLYREVQVSRGTIGSFEYGSGVIGGVIRLETKDASDFTLGEIGTKVHTTLEYSSNGDGLAGSIIGAWQPTENAEFLFNYTRRTLDVREDGNGNEINPAAGSINDPSWLAKGKFTFGTNLDQTLTVSLSETESTQFDVPYDTFGLARFGNVDRAVNNRVASLRYNYNPADNDLIDLDVELLYSDEEIVQSPVGQVSPRSRALLDADHRYETTTFLVKNTALFETGAVNHNLRTGFEYIYKDRLDASSAPGGTDKRWAIFAVDDISFGSGWTATPALRYETSDLESSTSGATFSESALMGGLSLRYEFDTGFSVFGSAAYTENLPILDDLTNPVLINQSEKARTWEIGAAYEGTNVFTQGDELAVKATYYDTNAWGVTTIRSFTPGNSVASIDRNGLEVELSYAMETGFYIDSNLDISNGDETLESGVIQDYRQNPADSLGITIGKKFGEEWDVSWEMVANARFDEGSTVTPGFAVHNLRTTYKPQGGALKGTEIRFGIENLFDRAYTSRLSTRPATGRNFKVTVGRLF